MGRAPQNESDLLRVSRQLKYRLPSTQLSEELGRFPGKLGPLHVLRQLKYCRKLPESRLAIRLEQLSVQLSEGVGPGPPNGVGLMRASAQRKYF